MAHQSCLPVLIFSQIPALQAYTCVTHWLLELKYANTQNQKQISLCICDIQEQKHWVWHTPPGRSRGRSYAKLKPLPEFTSMLHQKPEETQGCHDNNIITALFAVVKGQQEFRVIFIYRDLNTKQPEIQSLNRKMPSHRNTASSSRLKVSPVPH